MNEVEKFLEDTSADTTKVDVLDAPLIPNESEKTGEDKGTKQEDDGDELKPKNRRERRLLKQLREEREGSSFLAGKLSAREEAKASVTEESDYLKSVERIYGTDSPEAQIATDLLKKAFIGARDDAEQRAYDRIKAEREQDTKAFADANNELDNMLEELEDEHGVELNEAQETAFFKLLEKMSPKDREGNVTAYADADAVWEMFSEKLTKAKPDNRAKDMSSRSMTTSGASKESNLNEDVHARFLRENGII